MIPTFKLCMHRLHVGSYDVLEIFDIQKITLVVPSQLTRSAISVAHSADHRPNLAFDVNKVCQYFHAPRCTHWSMVKRILHYAKATLSHGLLLHPSTTSSDLLSLFSDVGWLVIPTTDDPGGFSIFYDRNLVCWRENRLQYVVSAPESEYKALANATPELIW
jgi:hypothetical protein